MPEFPLPLPPITNPLLQEQTKKRRLVFGIAAVIVVLIVFNMMFASHDAKQQPGMMTVRVAVAPGCQAIENADKILNMSLVHDTKAVTRLMQEHSLTCRWFREGDQLYIDHRAFNDAICMRQPGDTECYWINEGYLK
jgi:hypothetical protein